MIEYSIIVLVIIMIFGACGVPQNDHEKLLKIRDSLAIENNLLKRELRLYERSPAKLLSTAEAKFEEQQYIDVQNIHDTLLNYHPGTEEAEIVEQMVATIDAEKEAETLKRQKSQKEYKERFERLRKERKEAKQEEITASMSSMRKRNDEINEILWYEDKSSPRNLDQNSFHLYFGKQGNKKPFLRLRLQYFANDWLFIEKYTIKADGKIYTLFPDEMKRDNGYSGIWEWSDGGVDAEKLAMIRNIVASEKAILRSHGTTYYKDRIISTREKQAMKRVLSAFVVLGGTT